MVTPQLEDVLATPKLKGRTSRAPSLTDENVALHRLALSVKKAPVALIEDILDVACRLCDADSAGISVFENENPNIFRWIRIIGRLSKYTGGTAPRNHSGCGYAVSRGEAQLFVEPGRYFSPDLAVTPVVHEALVVPILTDGEAYGAIWVISHTPDKTFDMADVRVMTSLAAFATLACRGLGVPSRKIRE